MVTTRSSKPSVEKEKPKEMDKDNDNMEIEKTEEQKAEEKANLVIQDLKAQLKEIERAVHAKEPRVISKVKLELTAHRVIFFRLRCNKISSYTFFRKKN